jgi:hypothetical protein
MQKYGDENATKAKGMMIRKQSKAKVRLSESDPKQSQMLGKRSKAKVM